MIMEGKQEKISPAQKESVKSELAPLPFTYQRVADPEQAEYREWRVSPVVFEGVKNEPATDEEITDSVRRQHEAKQWYTSEYWRKKGIPVEQIEFAVNGRTITVYNWNAEKLFTDDHIGRSRKVFQELASRFPRVLDNIRWVLIDEIQPPSLLADDERYPTNGTAMREHQAFRFMPRGMGLIPHRIKSASNFEGTFVHELGHLIQAQFEPEWREKFRWQYCSDNEKEWEVRKAPNGENRWFNKQTGEMAPQGQYPLQPDQCVTFYAKQNMGEDICDSLVAYIYDPDELKRISPDKFDIVQKHDEQKKKPEVVSRRIPKEDIALPEVKPQTVFYYVEEPSVKG
jgi:hypothetical protein